MMRVKTFVGPSKIDGLGVFAGEPIQSGQLIWTLHPKFDVFLKTEEICKLPVHARDYIERYSYPHSLSPGVRILDSDNGRFMNHSDLPNTDFTRFKEGFALCDIAEGTELTCNYREFDPDFQGFQTTLTKAQSTSEVVHS